MCRIAKLLAVAVVFGVFAACDSSLMIYDGTDWDPDGEWIKKVRGGRMPARAPVASACQAIPTLRANSALALTKVTVTFMLTPPSNC